MHGSSDDSVPLTQTLKLATQLAGMQKKFGLVVFPGGNHSLTRHQEQRDLYVVEFFREHLVK